MLKSYNVFVDSARGTTLNLHEQAPSGGVVRVSLKSLSIPRSFSNLSLAKRQSLRMGIGPQVPVGAIDVAFINTHTEQVTLAASIYMSAQDVLDAMVDQIRRILTTEYPESSITRLGNGAYTIDSPMNASGGALYIVYGDGFPLSVTPPPPQQITTSFAVDLSTVDMSQFPHSVYLRIDSPTDNLESPSLAGGVDDTHLIHTDILGSVPLTRGEDAHTWRAWIPNERSFEVGGSLQALNLRLTDHRNTPLDEAAGEAVPFTCVLGVEVLVKHEIRTLGYGPAPSPVDAKDGQVYLP